MLDYKDNKTIGDWGGLVNREGREGENSRYNLLLENLFI